MRFLDENANLLAFWGAILIVNGMQIVELRGGFPPLFAVGLNSIKNNALLSYNHELRARWLLKQ